MFFFGLSAILVAIYDWNFRILQTINEYQKRTQQGKLVRNFFKFSLINGEEDEKIFQNRICPLRAIHF